MPRDLTKFSLIPLDSRFVGPKPKEWPKNDEVKKVEKILDLDARNQLIKQRKRNGHCAYIAVTGDSARPVAIYSRGELLDWTDNFPSIVEEVRSMNIEPGSLFGCEMILEISGVDEPTTFGRLSLSSAKRAVALQKGYPLVQVRLFNTIVHKNDLVITHPYRERFDIILNSTAKHIGNVSAVEVLDMSLSQAQMLVLQNKWEGLVVYDSEASSGIKMNGDRDTPPRMDGCWKWKPIQEDDFVVTRWFPSSADEHAGLVKDLEIAQYDRAGKLVVWGKVGNGLTDVQRRELADDARYPFVIEVGFERRTPNNRLIFARINRFRDDKTPKECIYPRE